MVEPRLAGFPGCCRQPPSSRQVSRVPVDNRPRAGRFSEFASLRAAFWAFRGGFLDLLYLRARNMANSWQVFRLSESNPCIKARKLRKPASRALYSCTAIRKTQKPAKQKRLDPKAATPECSPFQVAPFNSFGIVQRLSLLFACVSFFSLR